MGCAALRLCPSRRSSREKTHDLAIGYFHNRGGVIHRHYRGNDDLWANEDRQFHPRPIIDARGYASFVVTRLHLNAWVGLPLAMIAGVVIGMIVETVISLMISCIVFGACQVLVSTYVRPVLGGLTIAVLAALAVEFC
jgi:hypothetical protein